MPVENVAADESEPAAEQLQVMPKEEKPAESDCTCPYLRQQAADRHVRMMADPEVGDDVLTNLNKLEEADRLFELAGELMREGHVCEAMTCYDVIRHLVPGSRVDAQVDEALAEFGFTLAEAAEEPQTAQQPKKKEASCLEKLAVFLEAIGVPRAPLGRVDPSDSSAPVQVPAAARVEEASIPEAEPVSDDDSPLENRLRRPVSMHVNDMPLKTVLKDLRAFHGIRIRLDRKAVQEAGIDLERPVTVFLEDVSLRSALHLILHPAHAYLCRQGRHHLDHATGVNARGIENGRSRAPARQGRPRRWLQSGADRAREAHLPAIEQTGDSELPRRPAGGGH